VQADPLEEQHREHQVCLVAAEQPLNAQACPRLAGGERQRADHDVGVGAFGVGVGMVTVVLAGPPSDAEPDAQVAAQDADDVVGPL